MGGQIKRREGQWRRKPLPLSLSTGRRKTKKTTTATATERKRKRALWALFSFFSRLDNRSTATVTGGLNFVRSFLFTGAN